MNIPYLADCTARSTSRADACAILASTRARKAVKPHALDSGRPTKACPSIGDSTGSRPASASPSISIQNDVLNSQQLTKYQQNMNNILTKYQNPPRLYILVVDKEPTRSRDRRIRCCHSLESERTSPSSQPPGLQPFGQRTSCQKSSEHIELVRSCRVVCLMRCWKT